jgi:hypothetical protein
MILFMKNFKLQSCRSRRDLQLRYQFYIRLNSNEIVMIFLKFVLFVTAISISNDNLLILLTNRQMKW